MRGGTIGWTALLLAMLLALSHGVLVAAIPDDLTIQMFAKPAGQQLQVLVRVPLKALNGIDLPSRGANGELDLARVGPVLTSAARWWIADAIEIYEGDSRVPIGQVAAVRVSLPSDNAFASYQEALAHIRGAPLPAETQIVRDQAMLDALFDYPIRSDRSSFAIHSGLARLGVRVTTDLRFLPSDAAPRTFEYQGDPGLFRLEPTWSQTIRRFIPLGFSRLVKGTDYLLFLFCVALLLRNFTALILFAGVFSAAHSVTLIASAYNLASDALWFPTLIATLIAASIVYLAFENIAGGVVHRRWILAAGFGLVYGFGFAFALGPELQFAGSHTLASVLSFNAGVELGQFAVLLVLMASLGLLLRLTTRQRMETIILAALAADLGWHRFTERAGRLTQFSFQWPTLDAALLATAMLWLAILLVVAGLACLAFWVLRRQAARGAQQRLPSHGRQGVGTHMGLLLLIISILAAPAAWAQEKVALYAALGAQLTEYDVNIDSATLVKRGSVTLPANIQYAWPHPSRRFLYVAWSNGGSSYAAPGGLAVPTGSQHGVSAFRIDPATGALSSLGQPAMLPSRPIHVSVDPSGTHVLTAYNLPSGVTVHRLNADGTIGAEVKPAGPLDVGIYAHQVRVDPSNRMLILVTRGNGPTATKPEDPGGLRIFSYKDGVMANRTAITPNGGFDFQPRHLDFHPIKPWVFVSLERQHKLQVYENLRGETLNPTALFTRDSLADPSHPASRQNAGTVHVHPNGRFVYQANRSVVGDSEGRSVFVGGENSIAVWAINQKTGEPTLIQNVDTRGGEPRTFALDASARILVAANQVPVTVRQGEKTTTVPASLAVFRVHDDGKLDFVRKYDVEASGSKTLYWMGIVSLP